MNIWASLVIGAIVFAILCSIVPGFNVLVLLFVLYCII